MTFERWSAGLLPGYRPTLADLWQLSSDRESDRNRSSGVVMQHGRE
jgi:hypothetical protein